MIESAEVDHLCYQPGKVILKSIGFWSSVIACACRTLGYRMWLGRRGTGCSVNTLAFTGPRYLRAILFTHVKPYDPVPDNWVCIGNLTWVQHLFKLLSNSVTTHLTLLQFASSSEFSAAPRWFRVVRWTDYGFKMLLSGNQEIEGSRSISSKQNKYGPVLSCCFSASLLLKFGGTDT
jgi:hypothetical protein